MPEAALGAVMGQRDKGLSRVTVDSGSVCGERGGRGLNSIAGKWWVGAGNDEPLLEGQPGIRLPDAGAHARDACGRDVSAPRLPSRHHPSEFMRTDSLAGLYCSIKGFHY